MEYSKFFSSYPKIYSILERDEDKKFKKTFNVKELWSVRGWHLFRKYDGTNVKIGYMPPNEEFPDGQVRIGGRTPKADHHKWLQEYLEKIFTLEMFKKCFPSMKTPMTLYGEGLGEKIQGGVEGKEYRFVLFDVRMGRVWQDFNITNSIAELIGVESAELLHVLDTIQCMEDLRDKDFEDIEGFIGRPPHVMLNAEGERIMFKWTKKHHEKYKQDNNGHHLMQFSGENNNE